MADKRIAITITAATPQGGVHYAPKKGEPGIDLQHGETHEVDPIFARTLIHQKRAVLADPNADLDTGPLTTESLSHDPEVAHGKPPARRVR